MLVATGGWRWARILRAVMPWVLERIGTEFFFSFSGGERATRSFAGGILADTKRVSTLYSRRIPSR